MDYDVVIVGGGPVGCFVGRLIAEGKRKVLILEEHNEIGEPPHCAGLISQEVLSMSGIGDEVVLNRIRGANIYGYDGTRLSFLGEKTYALVIDRIMFDKKMALKAEDSGVEVLKGSRAIAFERSNGYIDVLFRKEGKEYKVKTPLVIGADGAHSLVARVFNLPLPGEIIYGFQIEGELDCLTPEQVDVMLDSETSPGWFSWIIPMNRSYARIGLGINVRGNPREYFDKLCKKWGPLMSFRNSGIRRIMGGIIPIGLIEKSFTDNVMLVGDSAVQLKPLSGGGLYLGLLAGMICSRVALEALERGDFSSSMLSKYHKLWMKSVGKEIKLGLRLRKIFLGLTDTEKSELLKLLDNQRAKSIILSAGNIDHPWRVAYKLMSCMRVPLISRMLALAFS
jgi:geranylgeranyl reductase family protein